MSGGDKRKHPAEFSKEAPPEDVASAKGIRVVIDQELKHLTDIADLLQIIKGMELCPLGIGRTNPKRLEELLRRLEEADREIHNSGNILDKTIKALKRQLKEDSN